MKLNMLNDFDKEACGTLFNLQHAFDGYTPKWRQNNICQYSIGIEIEIKFRHAYPDIFKQYILKKDYAPVNDLIKYKEVLYLKTIECGIPRGAGDYWEFSFNPVYNTSILVDMIELLIAKNLIPDGEHSLHITIGGLDRSENSYWILMILELLFINKSRLLENTWTKKGQSGIMERLYQGYEMRTLTMNKQTNIDKLFRILCSLLDNNTLITKMKNKSLSLGFNRQLDSMEIYHEKFNELRTWLKSQEKFI